MTAPARRACAGRGAALLVLLAAACVTRSAAHLEIGDVAVEPGAGGIVGRVELRNVGGRELLLHAARVDCRCRLAAALPASLAAGEAVTLAVHCRPGAAGAPAARAVRLLTSDPERADAEVRVTMPPRHEAALEAPALYFGYVAIGASATRDVVAPPGMPERPLPAASDPALTVESHPPRADGRRMMRLRFAPRAAGPVHATLAFAGGADALVVSGVGYGNVVAFPAEVSLPSAITGGAPPAIAVKALGASPIDVTGLELPPGVTGEVQPTVAGREFRLVVRAHGTHVGAGAAIRLRTSDPDEPILAIPVRDGRA